MASNKRDGSGSNFGLIITLVFFVLSTVILGITTYLSYAELEKKEKEKVDADGKAKQALSERDWYRFKSNVLVSYIGEGKLAGRTPAELAPEKKQLDEGTLTFASAAKEDAMAFANLVKDFDKSMRWVGTDVPIASFRSRLAAQDQAFAAQAKLLADARRQQTDDKAAADQAREDADRSKKAFEAQVDLLKKQRQADLVTVSDTNARLQKELDLANADKNNAKTKESDIAGALAKLEAAKKRADDDLKAARTRLREVEDERNEYRDKVTSLKDKYGVDEKSLEAQILDRNAVEALRTWNKDWRIVDMDRLGKAPYINLGTSDRIQPQVTFSVHEMGKDGRLNPVPKGTVEVVQARGPKLAQVSITSVKDPMKNPILKGDYLFNPTWDPNARIQVAIAGVVDLNDDRSDGTADFIRLLRRQNVELDSFIDASDEKAPRLMGPGISARTKYVVIADTLDQVNHPKAREAVYRNAYEGLVKQMRDKASANAVPVISLRKYLDMIGHVPPKVMGRLPQ
ncbi:MAG: hypothetical protein EBV06_07495 [Planctomycetia bacterium]|nr:hypothetical protein [Planctomycetia bacterium]